MTSNNKMHTTDSLKKLNLFILDAGKSIVLLHKQEGQRNKRLTLSKEKALELVKIIKSFTIEELNGRIFEFSDDQTYYYIKILEEEIFFIANKNKRQTKIVFKSFETNSSKQSFVDFWNITNNIIEGKGKLGD